MVSSADKNIGNLDRLIQTTKQPTSQDMLSASLLPLLLAAYHIAAENANGKQNDERPMVKSLTATK